ncbi:sorting nexin-32-like isoform X1 [Amphibalanus amphitrite]|uniref:sorting nexin-32-like isoform X1 n=1 Tax=Amphibalanus amphitrite TaxID=1232801 RepID=UPI001C913B22|nr:sorting nexin-32-like isoform X1 [Amphibalanus amphitrite]XP_043206856.1 sorting nexin-32-like isoform X1 [Amphibalanus amphitrite]XP_043206857.1 sorting nexin-32-like isoform X1 [Amphibalanus amphitrite]XP_043206858.1 sorting nexin-32-like isoform X1 [Amphibalanus amphitrite]XP_043206859.1 sorting nexin-32-like isoform X1 [Amphibalanus amphitrite]
MLEEPGIEDPDVMKEVPLKPGRPEEPDGDAAASQLVVDISDALSEREKVKFTVHTKTTLTCFAKPEFSVVRQHEEFRWLHSALEENADYCGFIIPPAPPRPDFDASREKLQKLGDSEGNMTKEEFNKMKQELEQEYLATFKKTVAMHETFLTRLAAHPVFRHDHNFRVFLEYDQDLSVRGKNRKERLEGLMKSLSKTTDELLLQATQRDVDDFFEHERSFVLVYHEQIKEATHRADRMTRARKSVADSYIKVSDAASQLGTIESQRLDRFLHSVAELFERVRKAENRVASDEDLKLSDLLRYYQRDATAVKALLYRRLRLLSDYEQANKSLEKARSRNREVHAAELAQQAACERFEQISTKAKEELTSFKTRRVAAFKKHLVELSELEIKQAKSQVELLRTSLAFLKALS